MLSLSLPSPSSSRLFLSSLAPKSPYSKPFPPLRSYPHLYTPSRSLLSRKNLNPHVSTSDSPSVSVPVADPLDADETSGENFDWYSHWYPLAPVCDLDNRAPRAVMVLGLDLVVWWDREEGQWRVFDDRCPHRLAPLSEGRIDRWGRLQCVYHGWCFDGAGSCKLIPQAPEDGPPNNIVWFWPKTEPQHKDILMKHKPPIISELDDPSYTCKMGMRDIPYGYEVLIENLMDPAHVPYAHHNIMTIQQLIMRTPKMPPSLTRDHEGGMPDENSIEKLDINGFLAKQQFGYSKFVAPCLYYASLVLGSSDGSISFSNSQTMPPPSFLKGQRILFFIFYCIPVSPGRSRLIWAFPRNFSFWIDQIIPRWMFHVEQNLILDSDLYLLHVEEHKIAEVGPSNWQKACFVPTKSDAMVTAFRRWLKRYANNQIKWVKKFESYLPPTPPREQLMDRYWTHVVQCSSCLLALKGMRVLEFSLPVISVALIGLLAVSKESIIMSAATRTAVVSMAVLCFAASRWLSHFIYKTFYFHDYNHAFK